MESKIVALNDATQEQEEKPYELLKALPREILNGILLQFCDGKALSTLAIVCATSGELFYRRHLYARISFTCRHLYQNILPVIQQSEINGETEHYAWLLLWIQLVDSGFLDLQSIIQSGTTLDLNSTRLNGIDDAVDNPEYDDNPHPLEHRSLRNLSEDLAVMDFLQRRGLEQRALRAINVRYDEWPMYVGKFSIQLCTTTHRRISANLQILSYTYPFESTFPLAAFEGISGTQFVEFRSDLDMFERPMGQLVGLSPEDDEALQSLATHLDAIDMVVVPNLYGRPVVQHFKIFTKRQATRFFDRAPADQRRRFPARLLCPRPMKLENPNTTDQHPLICCWDRPDDQPVNSDRSPFEHPRSHIDAMIRVLRQIENTTGCTVTE